MDASVATIAPSLQAWLLGPARIAVCGSPIPERAWSRRAAHSLLLLLLITPSHRLPRDQVLEALWPTARPQSADSGLRKVVHALRRVLQPDLQHGRASAFLDVRADAIALRRDVALWLDIDVFEQELGLARAAAPTEQRKHLQQALALYRDDLLADDPYAAWAEPARQRLRHRRRRAVLDLAVLDLGAGAPAESVPLLEHLLHADPTDEVALRAVMRALAHAGQRDEAMRWYGRGLDSLRTELDAEPEDTTRQLAEEIDALAPAAIEPLAPNLDIHIRDTIPAPPNRLIGRDRELEHVQDLLLAADVRLVTVTGPGGVGKTRLAQEVARQVLDEFADGVCYVALATVTQPSQVMPAVARALGLAESGTWSPYELIHAALRTRELLLVLDNLEQVIDAAPELATLLEACATVKILATSREPLRIRAEHLVDTPPLPVPGAGRHTPVSAHNNAVALFAERACAIAPDFTMTSDNVGTVVAICTRLDGVPLAIELAAAHSPSMSPEEMLERLADRFALLGEGYRDLPARHRTMRDAIAWSYDLLMPAEQALFRRLAVFVGGWSVRVAETVYSAVDDCDGDVGTALAALVDKSLVVHQDGDGGPRYGMLETIREYALECLEASGEAQALRRAHAASYLSLAEEAEPDLRGAHQEDWFNLLEDEHDNFRTALAWALRQEQSDVALRLAAALSGFWLARGYFTEGRGWLTRALQDGTAPLPLRAAALSAAGSLAEHHSDYAPAEALHREALAAWRTLGDDSRVGAALSSLGNVAQDRGEYDQALELHEQALVACREIDDQWGVMRALNSLGIVAYYQGAYDRAETFWTDGLSTIRALGDIRSECQITNNLGALAFQRGDVAQAAALHEQTLVLRRRLGDRQGIGSSLINLGEVAQQLGDLARAEQLFEDAVGILRDLDDERHTAIALLHLAGVACERGAATRTAALIGESLSLFLRNGDRFGLAGAMEAAASLLVLQKTPKLATRLYAAASALRETMGAAREPGAQARYDRDMAAVREALDDTAFTGLWEAGEHLSLEQAVTEAMDALGGGLA